MNMYLPRCAVVVGIIAITGLAGCGGSEPGTADAGGSRADSGAGEMAGMEGTRGMEGMPGMQGMEGMQGMASGGMMARMQARMDSMAGDGGGGDLRGMLPMHRQMTANMLSQMNREMRDMNMSGDAGWAALTDSLRQDLRVLPELTSAQLRAMMPAHRQRVMRLMGMHREMMAQMKR